MGSKDTIANTVSSPRPDLTLETLERMLAEAMMVPGELMVPGPIKGLAARTAMELQQIERCHHLSYSPCQPFRNWMATGSCRERKHVDSREVEVKQLTGG